MTVVWGLGMLGEATARVVLAFLIPPAALLAISPLLAAAFFGPLAAWTLYRRRHGARQDQAAGSNQALTS